MSSLKTSCLMISAADMLLSVVRPVIAAALAVALTGCFHSAQPVSEITGATMGSTYSIKWVEAAQTPSAQVMQEQVEAMLANFDLEVSTWRDDSALALFNALPAESCMIMPASVMDMVELAEQLHADSGGAFDLTVGPLLKIWGFHGGDGSQVMPDAEQLEATLAKVGQKHLRRQGEELCKDVDLKVDVSALAAGYMVDRVAEHLQSQGITSYMVEMTGELRAQGLKPDQSPWRIAIEEPRDDERMAHQIIALDGFGVSTSGDYRNYFELDGKRYSHTFDPVSGKPVMHELAAVTVLEPSAAMADGLSTVLLVQGPQRGWDYAIERGIAALFVIREGQGFISRSTPAFKALEQGKE